MGQRLGSILENEPLPSSPLESSNRRASRKICDRSVMPFSMPCSASIHSSGGCETVVNTGLCLLNRRSEHAPAKVASNDPGARGDEQISAYSERAGGFEVPTAAPCWCNSDSNPQTYAQGGGRGDEFTRRSARPGRGEPRHHSAFACDETPELCPCRAAWPQPAGKNLAEVRHNGLLAYLLPELENPGQLWCNENDRPVRSNTPADVSNQQHGPVIEWHQLEAPACSGASSRTLWEHVVVPCHVPILMNPADRGCHPFSGQSLTRPAELWSGGPRADCGPDGPCRTRAESHR